MKTVGEILTASEEFFQQKQVARPKVVAQSLLAFVLGMKRMDLYLAFDRPVDERELQRLRPLMKRAALAEPVEYIVVRVAVQAEGGIKTTVTTGSAVTGRV